MKGLLITGILLTVLGAGLLVFEGISYTQEETLLDVGPLEAEVEQQETIPFSPILGGVVCVIGVGLIIYARKQAP